jgi:hypothetical protein
MAEQLTHLTLLDVSDRELLLLVRDHANGGGFVWPSDIALALDIGGDHPSRTVSSRFAWLRRYGALERAQGTEAYSINDAGVKGWCLTPLGLAIATGKLKKQTEQTLEKLSDGDLIMLTRWMSGRAFTQNGSSMGRLIDREYRFGKAGGRR